MTITIQTSFTIIYCCNCGAAFAVPDNVHLAWHEKGASFFCPNGHAQSYTESMKKKLDRALKDRDRFQGYYNQETDSHRHTKKRLAATQGVVTRTKKRVSKGVCPCCNRHFKDLHRHMESKHPDYSDAPA